MRKSKMLKPMTVNTFRIEAIVAQYPGCAFSRLDICKALGRKKTSYMIRMIDRAASEGRIWRELHLDPQCPSRHIYFYFWSEITYTEEFEKEPQPGDYQQMDTLLWDGREDYPDAPLPMGASEYA